METFLVFIVFSMGVYLSTSILIQPPGRVSMWRFGYGTPTSVNDEQACYDGLSKKQKRKDQKCNICGQNEESGQFKTHAAKTIVKTYRAGQKILVKFNVTANVGGFSEFHVCCSDELNKDQEALQDCLDRNILYISKNKKKQTRYYVPLQAQLELQVRLQLPPSLFGDNCIIQWRHTGDKGYAKCAKGSSDQECESQPMFRSCADVSIKPTFGNTDAVARNFKAYLLNPQPLQNSKNDLFRSPEMTENIPKAGIYEDSTKSIKPFKDNIYLNAMPYAEVDVSSAMDDNSLDDDVYEKNQKAPRKRSSSILSCEPTSSFATIPGAEQWCQDNCNHNPPFCPEDHCTCPDDCFPTDFFSAFIGAKQWCMDNCNRIPPYCPSTFCYCVEGLTSIATTTIKT